MRKMRGEDGMNYYEFLEDIFGDKAILLKQQGKNELLVSQVCRKLRKEKM